MIDGDMAPVVPSLDTYDCNKCSIDLQVFKNNDNIIYLLGNKTAQLYNSQIYLLQNIIMQIPNKCKWWMKGMKL